MLYGRKRADSALIRNGLNIIRRFEQGCTDAGSGAMTETEEVALVTVLELALSVAVKARSVDHGLLFQIMALRDTPDSAPKEIRELLKVVEATPALEVFNHAYQCALGHRVPVNYRFLVQWLISRGQQVGSKQAVNDVARYLDSETIKVTAILAIDGFTVERNIKLGEYELIAWENVAMTDTKWQVAARGLFGGQTPTAVVIQQLEIPRVHVRPWDSPGPNVPLSIEPAFDILRCVTAVAGAGFRLLHYWLEPEQCVPWAVILSSFGVDSTAHSWPTVLSEAAGPQLRKTVSHLLSSDESKRLRLRVPLDRLNQSCLAGIRSIDKAIELGIALESLYAPAKLSEGIAFAVRTRAARFLAGSLEERRETVKILRDVYDLRSRAVHAGRFDAEDAAKKWRDDERVRKVLEQGQRLVGRSLVKIIQEGEPNWEEFDLASTEPTSVVAGVAQSIIPADGPAALNSNDSDGDIKGPAP